MHWLDILYEDLNFLAVAKPAGLVCHPTKGDSYSSLIGRVRLYMGTTGNPHMINRLDRETSGIVIIAKNLSTAQKLRSIWASRRVTKEYQAIVHGHPTKATGTIEAPIGPDQGSRVAIKGVVCVDGLPAITSYRVEQLLQRSEGRFARLHISPVTGRKHQIRIHLSSIGHPIVGDKLYGQDEGIYLAFTEGRLTPSQQRELLLPYHALHAKLICFHHDNKQFMFTAKPEAWFYHFCKNTK
jgi:23S rRNA pseudouridine1911/1915/1917 synthase